MTKQIRAVLAAAVLAPLAALAPTVPAGADGTTTIRIATYNVQVRRPVESFTAGVQRLAARSDIVGLQEMDTRDKEAVLTSMSDAGWDHWTQRTSFQMPVMWRSDRFSLVSGRSARISAETYIGSENPKLEPTQPARYVSVVRLLDHVTGHRVSVIDAHLIQGAVKGGRGWPDRPRLFALYKTELANLAALTATERSWGRVFVLGDFNAGWVLDRKYHRRRLPIRTFAGLSMQSMWAYSRPTNGLGTHNDALIDQVFSNLAPLAARVQFDISGYSDHWPALAVYATD